MSVSTPPLGPLASIWTPYVDELKDLCKTESESSGKSSPTDSGDPWGDHKTDDELLLSTTPPRDLPVPLSQTREEKTDETNTSDQSPPVLISSAPAAATVQPVEESTTPPTEASPPVLFPAAVPAVPAIPTNRKRNLKSQPPVASTTTTDEPPATPEATTPVAELVSDTTSNSTASSVGCSEHSLANAAGFPSLPSGCSTPPTEWLGYPNLRIPSLPDALDISSVAIPQGRPTPASVSHMSNPQAQAAAAVAAMAAAAAQQQYQMLVQQQLSSLTTPPVLPANPAVPQGHMLVKAETTDSCGQELYRLVPVDKNADASNSTTVVAPQVPTMPFLLPKVHCLVEFKRGRTVQYEAPNYLAPGVPGNSGMAPLQPGEYVVVGGDRGEDLGMVVHTWVAAGAGGPPAGTQYDQYGNPVAVTDQPMGKVIRRATPKEVQHLHGVQTELEKRCVEVCQQKVNEQHLVMSIVDAEYQFDRKKLTFYYDANERQDFRDLIRDLYKTYRARIWMSKVSPQPTP